MITVQVMLNGEQMLAEMRISNSRTNSDGTADYVAEIAVDRGQAVGMHSRVIYDFPRSEYNVLGLLKQALETLAEDEMRIEGGFARTPNLARRLLGTWSPFRG